MVRSRGWVEGGGWLQRGGMWPGYKYPLVALASPSLPHTDYRQAFIVLSGPPGHTSKLNHTKDKSCVCVCAVHFSTLSHSKCQWMLPCPRGCAGLSAPRGSNGLYLTSLHIPAQKNYVDVALIMQSVEWENEIQYLNTNCQQVFYIKVIPVQNGLPFRVHTDQGPYLYMGTI